MKRVAVEKPPKPPRAPRIRKSRAKPIPKMDTSLVPAWWDVELFNAMCTGKRPPGKVRGKEILHNGLRATLPQWARITKLSVVILKNRLNEGWSNAEAFKTPRA